MKRTAKVTCLILGGLGAAGVLLWWLMDHHRGATWAASVIRSRFPEISQISPQAVQAWLHSSIRPAPVLIDARSAEEFAVSHLPGAIHLDLEGVTQEQLKALAPSQPYIIYCSAGYRACQLARLLLAAGIHEVYNLEGGIFAWANEGRPVHRGAESVSEVHPYHSLFSRLLKPELRPQ